MDSGFITIDSSTNIFIQNVSITNTRFEASRAVNILSTNVITLSSLSIERS
jgi:hypothetical protein